MISNPTTGLRLTRLTAPGYVLLLLCAMYFVTYVDRVNVGTAASAIKVDLQLSNTQLGLIFSAFAYPYALLQVSGGLLADRLGPRRTLAICGVIWALATILTGLATGVVTMFLARVMLGFGEGATFPAATRAMQSWTARDKRGFAQGITHASARLGNAITPPLVAWLMVLVTWRGSFVLLGAVSLIWVLVWFWYFRDNPADHRGITTADMEVLPPNVSREQRVSPDVPWKRLSLRMMPVTIVYFCYGWSLWVYLNWLPSFFLHSYQMDIRRSALFSSGVFFAGVVGDTMGGLISDRVLHKTGNVRWARIGVISVGFLGSLLCLLPVLLVHDLTIIALALSGAFFFAELVIGPIWSIPMDIAPQYSGTAAGMMNTGSAIAAILSPLVFGIIIDATGNWELPFIGSIGLLALGLGLSFTLRPDKVFVDEPVSLSPGAATAD